jgi:hypothetical protein
MKVRSESYLAEAQKIAWAAPRMWGDPAFVDVPARWLVVAVSAIAL